MMTRSCPLSISQRLDWLRLIRSENVGPITFRRLLERFGDAGAALDALPSLAHRGGRTKPIRLCPKAAAEKELQVATSRGAELLCWGDESYPDTLFHVDDAPPCLYALGHHQLLRRPVIAIVGARNASAAARQFARKLARDLGQAGLTVVSGLARGLDASAHEGALETGTAAVVAGGIDIFYPPENRDLQTEIARCGVILSEMPPGTEPQARHFPRRNRIISGMSVGVVVIEASIRSGSLITARFAAEQGRDVFAVPGSPLDARCEGPNALLKDGAILTRNATDVLDVVLERTRSPLREPRSDLFDPVPYSGGNGESELAGAREKVLSALSPAPVMVDEILRQCQLSPSVVSVVLLELDLAGRLERHPGNRVSLLPEDRD